jgi:hypothetical protein
MIFPAMTRGTRWTNRPLGALGLGSFGEPQIAVDAERTWSSNFEKHTLLR